MKYISNSAEETINLGKKIGRLTKPGDVIALVGGLGSGKTTFAKGIAQGLNVADWHHVISPSFVIAREYIGGRIPLYHIDVYRLDKANQQETAGFEEYIWGEGVTLVEWAEKALWVLPEERLWIEFIIKGPSQRILKLKAQGSRYKELVKKI